MTKITFNGVNASGYTNCWGLHFPCGEAVSTNDKEAIDQAKRHPEFSVEDLSDPHNIPTASEEALVEAAKKFDHDGNGKPGGSKPRKAKKAAK